MLLETKHFYDFGDFRLDLTEKVLLRGGKFIPITPKVFETLCVLIESAGRTVEKDELMQKIWQDRFVEESNLTFNVGMLRKALGDDASQPTFIETVQRRGYRFIAEVRRVETEVKKFGIKDETLASQLNGKPAAPEKFSPSADQSETQNIGAVIDLADWQREADETKPEESAAVFATETSNGQIAKLELFPAKAFVKNKRNNFFYVLAGLILVAVGLGYYFFYAGKIASDVDGKKSIAILPLKPINTANRDDIYEIGIADSLIHRLSSMKGFVVRPLSATRKYADIEQDPLAAGREQQVDYVLTSNYQLAGGKIRITAQLFNVASGQIEETYKSEKEAGDVFAMQDAIAGEFGNILSARFAATSSSPAAKRGTNNEEAYRFYLHGMSMLDRTFEQKAVEAFEKVVQLDPNYAHAWTGLAQGHLSIGRSRHANNSEYQKSSEAINKALSLDPNVSEAYTAQCEMKFQHEWDFAGAERACQRALEINPNSSLAHQTHARSLMHLGRLDEAIAEIKTAIDLDPTSFFNHRIYANILYLSRRYDEAVTQYK
ncbi:MAG: winged helix-turn-helix domain-containing protein, partial [Acidobacteriota bacterium]|nr:winged helix-turn-helix domain-containing protein [Acidobacteriota bacterium]